MIRVVLLHGFLGDPCAMAAVAERVAELHARVEILSPWLPGHGERPDPVVGLAWDDAIDALATRLDAGPSLWVGYSMGARIALGIAARHPTVVRGLVLVSSHLGLIDAAERARRAADDEAFAQLADHGMEAIASAHEARPVLASQGALPPCLREALRVRRRAHAPPAIASAIRALGLGAMPDLRPALAALRAPLIAVAGGADPPYAGLAHEAAALAGGEASIVPDAGHDVVLEDPEQVTSAVGRALAAIEDGTRHPRHVTESHDP